VLFVTVAGLLLTLLAAWAVLLVHCPAWRGWRRPVVRGGCPPWRWIVSSVVASLTASGRPLIRWGWWMGRQGVGDLETGGGCPGAVRPCWASWRRLCWADPLGIR